MDWSSSIKTTHYKCVFNSLVDDQQSNICLKTNSSRGFHLQKKNSAQEMAQKENRVSWKYPPPPPTPTSLF